MATGAGHSGAHLPRHAGHRAGAKAVRATVEGCARRGIEALTLFAFSSENWQRPPEEVTRLMELFVESIDKEVADLHEQQHPRALHRRLLAAARGAAGEDRRRRGAHGGQHAHDAVRRRLLRRPLGHRRGRAPAGGAGGRGAARAAGDRRGRCSPANCSSPVRRSPTCSSAPAASSASAISCSGTWPIPSSISATRCGRISTTPRSRPPSISTPAASAASA